MPSSATASLGAYRVRVKICGITNREDALRAIDLGADALGFNFYPGSKRAIVLAEEADWICALPPFVARIAVLVNAPMEEAFRVATHPAIHAVQFHGDEDASYCAHFAVASTRPFFKALRLRDRGSFETATQFSTSHLLLDADAGPAYGGVGTLIDLDLAAQFAQQTPDCKLILAGGLNADNVAEAVRKVRPFAVDVASGVETPGNPRRKSAERIAAFVAACADRTEA